MEFDGKNGKSREEINVGGGNALADSFDASARPIVAVDIEKYQSFLDDADLSEDQKREFIETLWSTS